MQTKSVFWPHGVMHRHSLHIEGSDWGNRGLAPPGMADLVLGGKCVGGVLISAMCTSACNLCLQMQTSEDLESTLTAADRYICDAHPSYDRSGQGEGHVALLRPCNPSEVIIDVGISAD